MVSRALLVLALAGLPVPARADAEDRAYPVRVAYKLTRGITNIAVSWIEIPVNMYKEQQVARDRGASITGEGAAVLAGTFTGIGFTVARVLVGAVDVVTFPIATRPIMKPPSPHTVLETLGPPSPRSMFRLARRGGKTPRYDRRFWEKLGASDEEWYDDRWQCAEESLRNGRFNECLETLGWQRSAAEF